MAKLALLRPAALRDVDDERQHPAASGVLHRGQSDLGRKSGSVLPDRGQVTPRPHAPLALHPDKGPALRAMRRARLRRNERVDRSADQLAGTVSEHAFALGIGEDDRAVVPGQEHARRTGFDREPE